MATASRSKFFSRSQLQLQVHDDLEAGTTIPAILMAIMAFGLVTMVVSVWLAL
jgi:hypothetical protein